MRISQHNQQLVSERSSSSLRYEEAQAFGDMEGVQINPLLRPLRLSVLVPVYNERDVVEESLRRVLSLEHFLISSLEVIVVDDRSTDGTWPILQRLASEDDRIVLLRNERNLGK